ncbi:MAG TPA: UDP-N-acetylmuramate dehydrogenase [Stellaceae bacterium]|nr:UDP-N-acetylmuramate dehydrogenase [Stellaceae bacterium]
MSDLLRRLPKVRGRLVAGAPLAPLTWFRVGGPAEALFRPADEADLADFLRALPGDIALTVIGVGSNLLVRDGGIAGVTVRLVPGFGDIRPQPVACEVRAGAGALDRTVARAAAQAGIAGLEFLSGIPGTIGGGFRTNAGSYGSEFKDVLVSADAVDRGGAMHRVEAAALGLSYRHAQIPADWIFTGALFRGSSGDPVEIKQRIAEIQAAREASQPVRARTGGSTFANPPGHQAWQLIDRAACRGLTRGGAMVSQQHANFLINTGNATAADIEGLGEEVRRRVYERCGVRLEWEIRRIGEPLPARQLDGRAA